MAGMLSGDVQIPAVGKVPRTAAAGGVAVVAVLIGVYYYRKHQSASATATAASSATSTNQYPPDGTTGNPDDPYSTDPATGQTYGDESAGSGGTYGAYGTGSDLETTDAYPWDGTTGDEDDPYSLDPATGVTYGDEGLATGGTSASANGGPPFANNSDWETWAITQLTTQDPDINASDLTTALGLYLNGQPVSASQKTLIFDATGIAGDPPVAGPNNYPPSVQTNGGTGGSGAVGTTTQGKVRVPDVVGSRSATGTEALEASGFTVINKNPTPKGKTGTITSQSPKGGTDAATGSAVTITARIS